MASSPSTLPLSLEMGPNAINNTRPTSMVQSVLGTLIENSINYISLNSHGNYSLGFEAVSVAEAINRRSCR